MYFPGKRRRRAKPLPYVENRRPDGFSEASDCAVLALAAVLCVPYDESLALLTRAGRKPRRGTYWGQVEEAIKLAGFKSKLLLPCDLRGYLDARHITAARVRDYLPSRGHFYVCAGGHAFAVIDGVIHDNGQARPRAFVRRAIQLILE